MINHPNRAKSAATALQRMLPSFSLQSIEVHVSRDGFTLRAMPDGFHPIVAKRRAEAFGDKTEITMKEASEIQARVIGCVAQVHAKTLDEAVLSLRETLANIG